MQRAPGIRARPTAWQRLDAAGRLAFPFACTAALQLVLAGPIELAGQSALRPASALACIFFWTVYRPSSMTALAGFGLGLLVDLLGDGPIGINMVALLIAQGIALRWRLVLVRQDLLLVFVAFCGVALLFAGVVWSLDSLFAFTLLPLGPALFQSALAAGCYPVLSLFLLFAHRGLADPEQA